MPPYNVYGVKYIDPVSLAAFTEKKNNEGATKIKENAEGAIPQRL